MIGGNCQGDGDSSENITVVDANRRPLTEEIEKQNKDAKLKQSEWFGDKVKITLTTDEND